MIKMTGEVNREDIDRVCTAAAVNYFLPAERDQAVMWIVDGL